MTQLKCWFVMHNSFLECYVELRNTFRSILFCWMFIHVKVIRILFIHALQVNVFYTLQVFSTHPGSSAVLPLLRSVSDNWLALESFYDYASTLRPHLWHMNAVLANISTMCRNPTFVFMQQNWETCYKTVIMNVILPAFFLHICVFHSVSPCLSSLHPFLEDKTQHGRPELRWEDNIQMNLKKISGNVWTGFTWLRIGSSDKLLWAQWWTFGFHWRCGIWRIPERKINTQVWLCFMKLLVSFLPCYSSSLPFTYHLSLKNKYKSVTKIFI
jgi:hypothetical protein